MEKLLFKYLFLLIACISFFFVGAQSKKTIIEESNKQISDNRRNIKILDERKDEKGNTIRTIQYLQGSRRVTETITIPIESTFNKVPIKPDTLNKDSVLIIIVKSKYKLEVYYKRRQIRSYKAVFGPKPMDNKSVEGDRCTPEGRFVIENINLNSHYDKFLLLNYPNDSTNARLNKLKERGYIKKTAKPGGSVGIHGVWRKGEDLIDKRVGWTDGCIAIKNKDIDELSSFVMVGTKVLIKK